MRMPSYTNLCSFVFSLLLTSALIPSSGNVSLAAAGAPAAQMAAAAVLNGLRAQGMPAGAELALPSPAATPAAVPAAASAPAPTLTPEVMAKLLKLAADKGDDRDLNPIAAKTLGLIVEGQTWPCRSMSFNENNGTGHALSMNRGADQDLVMALNVPGKTYGFRLHRDGTAVAAFVFDFPTRQITMLSSAEAQKMTDVQVAFWSDLAVKTVTAAN